MFVGVVLDCCLHDEGTKIDLQVAVVMPDHVHLIFTPLVNRPAMQVRSLAEITDAIKGASAHKINKVLGRRGRVWQPESFDHVLRSSESLLQKVQYLLENPVRQGLAARWVDYPMDMAQAIHKSLCSITHVETAPRLS